MAFKLRHEKTFVGSFTALLIAKFIYVMDEKHVIYILHIQDIVYRYTVQGIDLRE
jgi:hypothetical protein